MKMKLNKKYEAIWGLLMIIGIIALINFFSYKIFFRWDLTQNKEFSASEVTKDTIKNIDDIIIINAYFSKKLPSQFISLRENVGDIFDNYTNYSNGKIRYEFIDPADDKKIASELYMKGIPELQFEVYEKDQLQLVKGYLGIMIQYGDKFEVIPVVQDTNSLEYQITLSILKLTSDETSSVAIMGGYGSRSGEEIKVLEEKLNELYLVDNLDVSSEEEIPSSLSTLIIIGPKEELAFEDLQKIDKYVMNGGNLLVLNDGILIGDNLQASPNNNGLSDLLDSYGIKINNDLVLEPREFAGMASFNQGFFTFSVNYPFWPKIFKEGFDEDNSSVSRLESVVLPWTSSISVDETKLDGSNISYLIKSSEYSWVETENFDLNPQQNFVPKPGKSRNLAVAVEGNFSSPYDQESTAVSKIVVVADSDFVSGRLAGNGDNLVLFQNLVDSLSLDADLVEIRAKGITDRPINSSLSDGQKSLIRYGNIFGVTVVVLIFGLLRYYLRKSTKFVDQL